MRELTRDQKAHLKKWFEDGTPKTDLEYFVFEKMPSLSRWEDLSSEQIEKLEKINDTEILSQETSRFLGDLYSKWRVKL
jgi:hypothetical protein